MARLKTLAIGLVVCAALVGCAGSPKNLGSVDGLSPCPGTPNCVYSLATDDEHRIAPLELTGDPSAAMDRLEAVIRSMPRTQITLREGLYLRATFTSRLFRFVDDVEFLAVPGEGVIHVRSASRVGHSDLGVNRKRVEAIRALYQAPSN